MITVLRFFPNPRIAEDDHSSPLVSRTLGKVCFIPRAYRGPSGEGFWLSDLACELSPDQPQGAFLAEPFQQIQYEDVVHLNPNNCTIFRPFLSIIVVQPVIIHTPEGKPIPWVLSQQYKTQLMTDGIFGVVVNLGGNYWQRVVKTRAAAAGG